MAHNSGFYQQGQPVQQQQQQQYSPMFQQPMNIYQQLGKPQPQPHLQGHPTYTAPLQQPQQQQPIQSQGFQFNQPQYVQAPPQPQQMQAPYVLSQTPYAPSQTPYQPSQTPYIPSQTPFSSQTPYPVSQTPYAPAQITYPQQQQPSPQYVAPQQQQAQPVYAQPAQPQISHIPTSSFPNQSSSAIPLNSSGSSWRVAARPPPVALSASLAQQAQAQVQSAQPQPQIQIPQQQAPPPQQQQQQQQATSTPQTPGRRPLPQPAPGVNAKTPALPPANTPKRIPTLPNANAIPSGSSKPFPIQPIQTNLPQAPKTPSPTRGRPLPTPTESGNKRNTVDLGKLPHASFGSTANSSAFSNASTASSSGSGWPVKKVDTSPTRPVLPSLSEQKPSNNANVQLSRTSSYAVNLASSDSSPSKATTSFPKRRESPPRFQSAPSSESNSPTKENPPSSTWNRSNSSSSTNVSSSSAPAPAPPTPRAIATTSSHSSSSTRSSADANYVASPTSATSSSSSTTAPPKKFVPMWRRTIPEMPAPAWGYAAGMVSEPHPQPPPQPEPPAPAPAAAAASPEKAKGKGGKLKKLFKGSSSSASAAPAPAPPAAAPAVRAAQYQPNPGQGLNSGYPRASASPVQQRYPAYQQQIAQYSQPQAHPRAYTSQSQQPQYQHYRQQQQEEEEEEETEEETEEDEEEEEEEEEEETEETEEDESDHRYHIHSRQRSQPQAQSKGVSRTRSQSRGRHAYEEEEEEEEQTPKRKVLRPKASKADPYADISPSGKAKIKPKLAPRRMELDENPSPKTKLRPKAKALARSMLEDEEEEEVDLERTPKKKLAIRERERQILEMRKLKHERSRSAFEERDIVRHRREPSEREQQRPRSGSAFAGSAPARKGKNRYEEEEEEEEDDISLRLAYDDEEVEEEDDSELEWLKKQKAMKKRRAAAAREAQRSETSSPQYGIRDLKPVNRRAGSGSGSSAAPAPRYGNRFEEPAEEEEQEQDYRQRRSVSAERQINRNGKEREWEYEQPERRYQNVGMGSGNGTGLPQPPMMRDATTSQERQIRGGPRLKSAPIKFDDYDPDEHRRQTSARDNLPTQFSAMNMNGNGQESRNRSDSRGSVHSSAHSSAWPVDLPRLPRTPGSATTPGSVINDGGGYFDIKPQSIPNSSTNFGGRQNQNQGEMNRHNYRDRIQNHRTNLDLDDPPPQASVVRTPSPGPTGYTLSQRRELPQPQGRPQSQAFPPSAERVAQQLARRRSLYNAPSAPVHQEDNMSKPRRPQSQVYDVQNSQMHHQNHQVGRSHPPSASSAQFSSSQLNHPFNVPRQQPQTPAPPPTVGIESPHPIGGREKLADIPKMEEDSNDGSDNEHHRGAPRIQVDSAPPSIPMINVNSSPMGNGGGGGVPMINVDSGDSGSPRMRNNAPQAPQIQVFEVPGISVAGPFDGPSINISGPDDHNDHQHGHQHQHQHQHNQQQNRPLPPQSRPQTGSDFGGRQSRPGAGGLICGGCNGPIIGRIVSAMGSRYHPACFKCTVCNELLEHVSSYEHNGRPYCHLDYHENFAPRCYSCKTAIIEEQFISLDDPALGKRAYHTQHFFCSECGDPFLTPSGGLPTNSQGELAVTGDGEFEGFTVYKGYPYCEACHVRLRLPKCKRCKRSIRDSDQAVEALGGKWCWACFVCASCEKPFENPSFFQRDDQPYCEHCFSIMLRNEV